MDVILDRIEACIASAKGVEDDIHDETYLGGEATQIEQQRAWIQRQLATLVSKLLGMQEDLNAGLSIAEMGFADNAELQDFLQDLETQIAQLKSLAQSISKGLGQGL